MAISAFKLGLQDGTNVKEYFNSKVTLEPGGDFITSKGISEAGRGELPLLGECE